MNYDISAMLTPQRSTIICHNMKHNIKRKKKRIQNHGGLGQWQENNSILVV